MSLFPRQFLEDFGDDILVVCPRCEATARVGRPGADGVDRRVVCGQCGFHRDSTGPYRPASRAPTDGAVCEPCFHLPLRLQTPCVGEVLWAYNHRHLGFLDAYVRASLRERRRHPSWGWSNGGLESRLPRWLKAARHRDAVLTAIAALRARG